MTTTAVCPTCGAAQTHALLCHECTTKLERDLRAVPHILTDLDITLSKQARTGDGGPAGLALENNPINARPIDPRWVLDNVLTTWARDIAGPSAAWLSVAEDSAGASARALLSHIDAIRRHPAAAELHDEITDAIRNARRATDRPPARQYLSKCHATTPDPQGRDVTCLAELWAGLDADTAQCQECGAQHKVRERRALLLQRAADTLLTVAEASLYVGQIGQIRVTQASIRSYLHRKRIAYRPGTTLIRLGDLLTVVTDDSQRQTAV